MKSKKILIFLSLIILTSILVVRESRFKRPVEPVSEGCVFCHTGITDPDPSHPISAFGCHTCHMGNPYSLEETRAHLGMVINPGDLRVVDRTCGKAGCHADIVPRVKNSIMATNRGILKTIQYQWLNRKGMAVGVSDLMAEDPPRNLAIDHYRKMCGGCHLWKERGDRPGEIGRRGGGCSDCHVLDKERKTSTGAVSFEHPEMTTRIPSENCIKCHNRSARIGLSYFGRFESARYGTPYEGRMLSSRRLSGNRFFLELEADIHYSKAGMECIDCHTSTGLMGDGKSYDKMEEQVDITCEACHSPQFKEQRDPKSLGNRLVFLNGRVPAIGDEKVGVSKKGTPLYNLRKRGDSVVFYRKRDGHAIEMQSVLPDQSHHNLPGHSRLSCQACHSAWIPQCYGCHLTYEKSGVQRDWINGKLSPGKWKETRSYIRFSKPALGLKDAKTIYPVSPCQVFVSILDEEDRYRKNESFNILTMSAFDPHTTSRDSRKCTECHGDPKVLGFGEGILMTSGGKKRFRSSYDAGSSGLASRFSLDSYVTPEGEQLQTTSREESRPFNKQEVDRILSVNSCAGCHNRYDDAIYRDFRESRRRFEKEPDLPCRK